MKTEKPPMKTMNGFDINFVFMAYVPPNNDFEDNLPLQTEVIKSANRTTDYLFEIFDSSFDKCKIEINFKSDEKQNNEIRNEILSICTSEKVNQKAKHAYKLAEKLYDVTDNRNGTGLFLVIQGIKATTTRIVLCRFKGDEGLYKHGKHLTIEHLSEIFTKKSNHYKLVFYEEFLSEKSFWRGFATDRQISANDYKSISTFWIEDFLQSQTALTSAQGTLMLSKVLKKVLSNTFDISEQEQIISAVVNLRTKGKTKTSVSEICKNYLSQELTNKIKNECNDDFYFAIFEIDTDVYRKEFGKTVLSLEDGITAYIPTFSYKKHVTESTNADGSTKITIEANLNSKKINVEKKEKIK
jgi:hypothetical protein